MSDVPAIERFSGCLLGGAVGDALGAPVELMRMLSTLRGRRGGHSAAQAQGMPVFGRTGAITDDTQMTLFTAEGLLRATRRQRSERPPDPVAAVHQAYLRWLRTQTGSRERLAVEDGWLLTHDELWQQRGAGGTCLSALRSGETGSLETPINDSKGGGGVMRVAPVGLWARRDEVFEYGSRVAALTHGHPTGYRAAGAFAVIIAALAAGDSLQLAVVEALAALGAVTGGEEVIAAIEQAQVAAHQEVTPETLASLGEGWVADEALGIALCCALAAKNDFAAGVRLAANHVGDTDSTASIAGNILGTLLGRSAIPPEWLETLELREVIERVAADLYLCTTHGNGWVERYPLE